LEGEKPEDYPFMRRERVDEDGVSWPCLVDPFALVSTYLYEKSSSSLEESTTATVEVEQAVEVDSAGDVMMNSSSGDEKVLDSSSSQQQVTTTSTAANAKNETQHHTCSMAYGGVILNYTSILNHDGPTVKALLEHIPKDIPSLTPEMLSTSSSSFYSSDRNENSFVVKINSVSKLDLKYSDDDGATQIAVELATRTQRFVAPINVGVLFYMELEIGSIIHKIGISLTRAKEFSVFQHNFYDKQFAHNHHENNSKDKDKDDTNDADEASKVQKKEEDGAKGQVKLMTYNLWNVNPPTYAYKDNKERWMRYNKRIDHFVKVCLFTLCLS
jgi:hypothetical protein